MSLSVNEITAFFQWCFNESIGVTRSKEMLNEILEVVSWNVSNDTEGDKLFPMDQELRLKFLQGFLDEHINKNRSFESAFDLTVSADVYKKKDDQTTQQFWTSLHLSKTEVISKKRLENIVDSIDVSVRNHLRSPKIEVMKKVLEKINNLGYASGSKIDEDIGDIIFELYDIEKRSERARMLASQSSCIVGLDDCYDINEYILGCNDPVNRTPTGFEYVDSDLGGGFQMGRIYIIAGGTASGKSAWLLNAAHGGAMYNNYRGRFLNKKKLFPYITLENNRKESYTRLACSHFGLCVEAVTESIRNNPKQLHDQLKADLLKNNSYLPILEYQARSINALSIGRIIEDKIEQFGGHDECVVAGIYLDYLDLVKYRGTKNLYEALGEVTDSLRDLSKDYDVPVITATQLNRSGSDVSHSRDLDLRLMGDSHKKSTNADVIIAIGRDPDDENLIHYRVVKNRGGKMGTPLDLKVDYSQFRFISASVSPPKGEKKERFVPDSTILKTDEKYIYGDDKHKRLSSFGGVQLL